MGHPRGSDDRTRQALEGAQTLLVLNFPVLDSFMSHQGRGTDPCDLTQRRGPIAGCAGASLLGGYPAPFRGTPHRAPQAFPTLTLVFSLALLYSLAFQSKRERGTSPWKQPLEIPAQMPSLSLLRGPVSGREADPLLGSPSSP